MFKLTELFKKTTEIEVAQDEIVTEVVPGDCVVESGDIGIFIVETLSPYYHEERFGILRCYVVFVSPDGTQTAADWVLRGDMKLVKKGVGTIDALPL